MEDGKKPLEQTIELNRLQPYVRLVQHIEAGDDYRLPPRIIYDHELLFVVEGRCEYIVDGETHMLQAGDLQFIQPHVRHSARVLPRERFRYYAVHFDYAFMGEAHAFSVDDVYVNQDYYGSDEIAVVEELTQRPVIRPGGVDFPLALATSGAFPYEAHFAAMLAAFRRGRFGDELIVQASLLHILGAAIGEWTDESGIDRNHPHGERIHVAISFMQRHYAEQLDLAAIAGAVHVSPSHFRALFKEATGLSPIACLTNIRMDQARRRLRENGDQSIAQVALQVGYPDLHYFSKLFKKLEGLSPRQYADSLRIRE